MRGTLTLIAGIEKIIMRLLLARVKTNQPLTCNKGLAVINLLIQDSDVANNIIIFKNKKWIFIGKEYLMNKEKYYLIAGRDYFLHVIKIKFIEIKQLILIRIDIIREYI